MDIRPVSDLRNKFADIEKVVQERGHVILTKNGYGAMVVMSIDEYSRLIESVELALDEADAAAENDATRMSHSEVFGSLRSKYGKNNN